MSARALLVASLGLLACTSRAPQEKPVETPIVEVAAATASSPPEPEEEHSAPQPKNGIESTSACIGRARSAYELNPEMKSGLGAQTYAKAFQWEREGNTDQARKEYLRVIQLYPQSLYAPFAYFAFGELFLREAEDDPSKLALAERSYQETQKYRDTTNFVFAASYLRLADIYRRRNNHLNALATLKQVLEMLNQEPERACASPIAADARSQMVTEYAEVGRPEVAFSFFRRASGDKAGENHQAALMCAMLGELYVAKNKAEQAMPVLLSIPPGQYGPPFCPKEALLVEKLQGLAAQNDVLTLRQEHARRCDKY